VKRDDFVIGLLIGLVIGVFGGVGVSKAAPISVSPSANMAYNLAVHHWGDELRGCTSIDAQVIPDDPTNRDFSGESTNVQPGAAPEPCFLYIVRRLAKPFQFAATCALMFHMVGHLQGYGFSDDPDSLLYPVPTFVPRTCMQHLTFWMNHPHYGH
jgi:hypothetical protein